MKITEIIYYEVLAGIKKYSTFAASKFKAN